jgi:hypothetical protein
MHYLLWLTYIAPFIIFLLIFSWSFKNGIGPNPSSAKQTRGIIEQIPTDTVGNIIDLGSGWGTLAIAIAKRFPQATVIGYESSPVPYLFAKVFAGMKRLRNLHFYRKNFLKVNLKDASVIVCYLHRGAMKRLGPKLMKELNPGTRVISNTFSLTELKPSRVIQIDDLFRTKIYCYTI